MAASLVSVIDDDVSLMRALVGLIRSLGYRASGHHSAEDFLGSGELDEARCVVTDIQMGGLSGIDLKLRMDLMRIATPVIMITAQSEPTLLKRAERSGPRCLLRKPFNADEFISCLETALA